MNEPQNAPLNQPLTADLLGETLLRLAREAIGAYLGRSSGGPQDPHEFSELMQPAATFVTLMHEERLRGCVGSLEARRPLLEDVRENAIAAAFRDPRFEPLTRDELHGTRVEVSLLSTPDLFAMGCSEEEVCAQLVPGTDGLILSAGSRRATFLPQVWETLPDPRAFLTRLKLKAGIAADEWPAQTMFYRYRVTKWKEIEN